MRYFGSTHGQNVYPVGQSSAHSCLKLKDFQAEQWSGHRNVTAAGLLFFFMHPFIFYPNKQTSHTLNLI